MRRIYPFVLCLLAWVGLVFSSCAPTTDAPLSPEPEEGFISGAVVWKADPPGCWPPNDTCFVASAFQSSAGNAPPAPMGGCWPPSDTCAVSTLHNRQGHPCGWPFPDTCYYSIGSLPLSTYFVAVEWVDSLYRASNGGAGIRKRLGYYAVPPDSATEVMLTAAEDSLSDVNITVSDTL